MSQATDFLVNIILTEASLRRTVYCFKDETGEGRVTVWPTMLEVSLTC